MIPQEYALSRNTAVFTESSVMKSTVMNSSKEMSAYSTFPPDKHAPNYMHHLELLEYFRNYARHYNLEKYIRFRHNVVHVERASHYESTKQWIVRYTNEFVYRNKNFAKFNWELKKGSTEFSGKL